MNKRLITDPKKEQIRKHFSKDTKAYKFLDWLGGEPLDGYKPFTIKQDYFHNGNNVLPVFNPCISIPVSIPPTRVGR